VSWPTQVREAYDGGLGGTATVDEGFGPVAVDVPAGQWGEAVILAREELGCTFFDWLSAVDESDPAAPGPHGGVRVVCHLARHRPGLVEHLVVRTLLGPEEPSIASVAGVFAGARWHERETHEMFGIDFTEHGETLELAALLLPEEFVGHPLRKDFVLAARVAKTWPGAKEPGESDADQGRSRSRRKARPPGVPDPAVWGPRHE